MAGKLQINVDSYERLVEAHAKTLGTANPIPRDIREYEHFTRGDSITPRDDAERKRLVDSGIAIDPNEANRRDREELNAQLARLEAEKKRLDEDAKAIKAGGSDSEKG